MFAHCKRNTFPPGVFCNDITAIADVGSERRLVWLNVVGAEDFGAIIFSYKSRSWKIYPNLMGLFFRDIRRISLGLTSPEHGFDNPPSCGPILIFNRSYLDHDLNSAIASDKT